MVRRLGLWVGDSFAETRGIGGPFTRWFLPKKSLGDGLREALRQMGEPESGGELVVASSRAESALERRLGSAPALLVSSGFETRIRARAPTTRLSPALRARKTWSPVPESQIFGITESISGSGEIKKPLQLEELEFIAAKLELIKVKDVAIHFEHATLHPQHEKQAASFLRERGMRVVMSHSLPAPSWMAAVEAAYVESVVREDAAVIRAALEAEGFSHWSVRTWTARGVCNDIDGLSAASLRGGTAAAISSSMPASSETSLFLGLEEFIRLDRTSEKTRTQPLLVQPTGQIGHQLWHFPTWTAVDRGYEPGPMLFGKSHQLTLLDVLFVRKHLQTPIEAFSDRVQEKSAPRILEALFTLGKNLAEPGRRAADPQAIAADLERAAIERIAIDLVHLKSKTTVLLSGALAPAMQPLLTARRPDLAFQIDTTTTLADIALAGALE